MRLLATGSRTIAHRKCGPLDSRPTRGESSSNERAKRLLGGRGFHTGLGSALLILGIIPDGASCRTNPISIGATERLAPVPDPILEVNGFAFAPFFPMFLSAN